MRGLLPAIVCLLILPGCAATPGLPGAVTLVLVLTLFSACNALANLPLLGNGTLDDERLREALLRTLIRSRSGSSSSSSGVVCTGSQDYTQSFDLSSVDPATAGFGFTLTGENATDRFGSAVAGAGDFNGDGISDIVVGAYYYGVGTRGRAYVIFGRTGAGGDIDTTTMTSGDGVKFTGQAGDYLGHPDAIQSAGDVNGDGYDDLLVGAHYGSGVQGNAYLIFGKANPTDLNLASLAATDGVVFQGDLALAYAGTSVAGLGDINGDGLDDFVINQRYGSTYGAGNYGEASILYGKTSGWANTTLNPTNIAGSVGFTVRGEAAGDFWDAASRAGDLNGDGLNDVLIGAYSANGSAGAGYVIYGASGSSRPNLDLFSGPIGGSDGFEVTGGGAYFIGRSVAGGGDFNGDGTPDFALGSFATERVTLVYGDVGTLNLASLGSSQGARIYGYSSYQFSRSMSMKGDVDGDGQADLLVGAPRADFVPTNSGGAFLVFGQSGIPTTGASFSSYTDGVSGIRIEGSVNDGQLGMSVDLSDVNGDGCADIIAGAPYPTGVGTAYVILGGQAQ